MTDAREHDKVAPKSFLEIFAQDDTVDERALEMLELLALQDEVVDASERDVLRAIFDRVDPDLVDPAVWLEMEQFRQKHGF